LKKKGKCFGKFEEIYLAFGPQEVLEDLGAKIITIDVAEEVARRQREAGRAAVVESAFQLLF
jgi:hypothetical protein